MSTDQMNTTLKLPCDVREVSDGYHTFAELYDHRAVLLISLMRAFPKISWRSQLHDDGTMFGGFFVAGMGLPSGMITYHLEMKYWNFFDGTEIETRAKAPPFDGHSPSDVLYRLLAWMHPECSALQLPDKD
jgi:hypothetical protein